jgi:tetratricopeptide (TPR) repeat protein
MKMINWMIAGFFVSAAGVMGQEGDDRQLPRQSPRQGQHSDRHQVEYSQPTDVVEDAYLSDDPAQYEGDYLRYRREYRRSHRPGPVYRHRYDSGPYRYRYDEPHYHYRSGNRYGRYYGGYSGPYQYHDPYDAYWEGRQDGRLEAQYYESLERNARSYGGAMESGYAALNVSDYGDAARHFLLAADLNHGDPVSRLLAAGALIGNGRYAQAADLVERAVTLQPRILYLPVDLRSEYARPADFENHYNSLAKATNGSEDSKLWMLRGYVELFSGRQEAALASMKNAKRIEPESRVIGRLLNAAESSTPRRDR